MTVAVTSWPAPSPPRDVSACSNCGESRSRPRTLPSVRAIRRFTVRTVLPSELVQVGELAHNLRWSWHAPTRDLFSGIDPRLWAKVHGDPVALLGALGRDRLAALAADTDFVARVQTATDDLHQYLAAPLWYQSGAARYWCRSSVAACTR